MHWPSLSCDLIHNCVHVPTIAYDLLGEGAAWLRCYITQSCASAEFAKCVYKLASDGNSMCKVIIIGAADICSQQNVQQRATDECQSSVLLRGLFKSTCLFQWIDRYSIVIAPAQVDNAR